MSSHGNCQSCPFNSKKATICLAVETSKLVRSILRKQQYVMDNAEDRQTSPKWAKAESLDIERTRFMLNQTITVANGAEILAKNFNC